ncbi:MAG: hypothetical protein L3K04_01515 [Thermoplasmata archaeon]|nr:hypothetical protein [Thermoplasmata archaeon]MCI4337935.1 hypothetical protein [Thermoplasmata archaeon]MCI4341762.1 hypothetical protein [Thermoplasmata archaeon]
MAWTIFTVLSAQRTELDAALRDDVVGRQSQTVREASTLGGPAGTLYVFIEGAPEPVARAETLLAPLGKKLPAAEGEALYARFKAEEESASAGMGLFFTE